MDDWISVNKALPKASGRYLIVLDGIIEIAHYSALWKAFNAYDESAILDYAFKNVTHWQPLPLLPSGI